ncbi:hypothetical protein [Porphyromonas asaccharolytica]|uniref:hypothetical protein n=1 Tax=Porphyromonas asaccharolytica TaxID=28123 RepID=UPI00248DE0E3|nr:hypothetical protein [Porphyromonas asaccharolytica]
MIDPLWVGLDEENSPSPTSHTGEVACFVWLLCPRSRSGLCPSDWGLRCVRPQAVVSNL